MLRAVGLRFPARIDAAHESAVSRAASFKIGAMHFRLPSFARGVTAFFWALGLSIYVWAGLLAIGVQQATALIVGALCVFGIFIFVRLLGEDERRR